MSRVDPARIGLTIPPEPTYPPGELMHHLAHERVRSKRQKRKGVKGWRRACFERDGWACRRCGALANLTVHHVHKQEHGGGHDLANLLTLCRPCHVLEHQKEHRDPPPS